MKANKARWRLGAAATLSLLLGAMIALDGCSAAPPAKQPPQWLRKPLAAAPSSVPSSTPTVTPLPATVADPKAVFDPQSVVAIIDDPALAKVRADVERKTPKAAANKLAAMLREMPADDPKTPRWQFFLGTLRRKAADPVNAVTAFDRASATSWPLADHARLLAAEMLIGLDQPGEALVRLTAIRSVSALDDRIALATARAHAKSRNVDAAAEIWRSYLARTPRPSNWVTVALRMTRALLNDPSVTHAEEAARISQLVIYQGPRGRGVDEARRLEEQALATIPSKRRAPFKNPDLAKQAQHARELADSRQGQHAVAAADALLEKLSKLKGKADPHTYCEAHLARTKGLGLSRRYGDASDAASDAIAACNGLERQVAALFVGGRYALRAKKFALARERYAGLERAFPNHRFADDARLHGAEAALELGDEVAFNKMLSGIAEAYPDGDMVDDALFALARSRMAARDWPGAVAPLEKSVSRQLRGRPYYAEGRPHYFLARVKNELSAGKGDAALAEVIKRFPLSYYMVLAYSRLAQRNPALASRTLRDAIAKEPAGDFVIADHKSLHSPGFLRAVELVRQGVSAGALAELNLLGVRDSTTEPSLLWASAFLLSRINAPAQSHGVLRNNTELWREHYPAGVWRSVWGVAYPQPFLPLVKSQSKRFGVPEHLAYGIMREESAFNARVVSHAGAYGLMQLIMPTAKNVGKRINIRPSKRSLKKPAINIQLGVRYLSELSRRFPQNPLLAIPGYNAGPGAPKRWVKKHPEEHFDLFVERIPYRETRHYTKRVIQSMAAYAMLYGKGMDSPMLLAPIKASPPKPSDKP